MDMKSTGSIAPEFAIITEDGPKGVYNMHRYLY